MEKQKSNWVKLKEYLEKIPQGAEVTRQELIKEFPEIYQPHSQGSTLDTYRRLLTVFGTLDETSTPGVYKKGYIDLGDYWTKSKVVKEVKKLYVFIPDSLLSLNKDIEMSPWSYWERYIYQSFFPKELFEEWKRGMVVKPDIHCLGFRFYRIKMWNTVTGKIDTIINNWNWSGNPNEGPWDDLYDEESIMPWDI